MFNTKRIITVCLCISGLSACTSYQSSTNPIYQYSNEDTHYYPMGYQNNPYSSDQYQASKTVVVPESYHMSLNHSPTPHTDRDRTWMNSQNAQSYTIELADGDKASDVAKTLYQAPKTDRMAEIKYQKEGKTYYKGVYGTYPNQEAAEQALKTLPEAIKQNAGVKTWGSIQTNVGD